MAKKINFDAPVPMASGRVADYLPPTSPRFPCPCIASRTVKCTKHVPALAADCDACGLTHTGSCTREP